MLSGLLRCGSCGSGMSIKGKDGSGKIRIRCSADAESGSCGAPRTFYLDTIEKVVLDTLAAELKDPKLIVEYVEAYVAKRKQLAQNAIKSRSRLERKLAALKRDKDRAIDAYTKEAMTVEELKEKLPPIREAIAAVEVELSRQPEIPDRTKEHTSELQ